MKYYNITTTLAVWKKGGNICENNNRRNSRRIRMETLIKFKDVKKVYNIGEKSFNALDGVNFTINKGEFVVILRTKWSRKINLT